MICNAQFISNSLSVSFRLQPLLAFEPASFSDFSSRLMVLLIMCKPCSLHKNHLSMPWGTTEFLRRWREN